MDVVSPEFSTPESEQKETTMKWLPSRGPVPEPPDDRGEWTRERKQKACLLELYGGDVQRAVTAWEAYQQDSGKTGRTDGER